ncbi:MAG: hypothetical protein KDI30_04960 [Pseudomonadales bacterium]|nr:hypothetical protein [Pseudomonadales bacterium]
MKKVFCMCLLGVIAFTATSAFAEEDEMMVDKADSLDFESFHEDSSITIFSTDGVGLFSPGSRSDGVNTYEEDAETGGGGQQSGEPSSSAQQQQFNPEKTGQSPLDSTGSASSTQTASGFEQGQKVNIRATYRLNDSDDIKKATFSLYQQMNQYCPAGWEKLREWSLPVDSGHYYLHYQFRCL